MNQTTNIRRIMDRLGRNKMLRDIPFETAVEYTIDFLSLLATPGLYEEKTAIVKVEDWRGALPCDFIEMVQVRVCQKQHSRRWIGVPAIAATPVFRESGDSFHMSNFKPNESLTGELTYQIQGMFIFTSTKDVDLEIAYRAICTDDEGYPLLPENTSFLRGLEAYIKMKWYEMKYEQGELPQEVMQRTDQEYCWAVAHAQSEFSRLSLDQAQTLFNSFKTLLPRNNEHWKAFFTNGATEIWKH